MPAAAEDVARKIEDKITRLLAPLEIEMRISKWKPEYRAIVWEAVSHRAMQRALEAEKASV